ncbi:hypothetical protein Nmel_010027 [Mimus melanotis]
MCSKLQHPAGDRHQLGLSLALTGTGPFLVSCFYLMGGREVNKMLLRTVLQTTPVLIRVSQASSESLCLRCQDLYSLCKCRTGQAQNDSSLFSVHFHILGAVVLPGARCHTVTVQIPAWQQLLLRTHHLKGHSLPSLPSGEQTPWTAQSPVSIPETTTALSYNHSHSFRGSFLQREGARLAEIVTTAQGTSHSQRHSCEVTFHLEPNQIFITLYPLK